MHDNTVGERHLSSLPRAELNGPRKAAKLARASAPVFIKAESNDNPIMQ
jgi:hypothetical protein